MDYKDSKNKQHFMQFKNNCIKELDDMIDTTMSSDYKKAVNLTYWIRDYKNYLKQEETFRPVYLPVYKYGAVVEINLGFRVGSEFGGLHYGIVVNKNDKKTSPTLTIIPMRSMKKKIHYTELDLGDEFYNLAQSKVTLLVEQYKEMQERFDCEALQIKDQIQHIISRPIVIEDEDRVNELTRKVESLTQQVKDISSKIDDLENGLKRVSKLKNGSLALPNQVLTISKMRVKDPLSERGTLYNITLSKTTMERLKNKFHTIYFD